MSRPGSGPTAATSSITTSTAPAARQNFPPEDIVFFRYPDPRDPYPGGLSPLRACFEQVVLASEYAAIKSAIYENRAIPGAVISPDEVIGEEERDRLKPSGTRSFAAAAAAGWSWPSRDSRSSC